MSDPATALHRARKELLDLSPRNRLLDAPRHARRASALEILDARSEQVFQMLAREGRRLGFSSGPGQHRGAPDGADDPFAELLPPATDVRSGTEGASAEVGASLQTGLTAGKLHGRLLRLHHEARTAYEEQGLSPLFLALGFLEWEEAPPSRHIRRAPLVLLPVRLERQGLGGRFTLAMADGEIAANICLMEKLEQDFALELPAPPEPAELEPGAYLWAWTNALRREPRFIVHRDDIELGLFSFTSFLMYRDLDPVRWPASTPLVQRPLIRALLGGGFGTQPGELPDDAQLDELLSPLETVHVLDADSTQAVAIEEVRRGRNLLIQGPPGSGKSQTIANLIAGAVRDGKKILFVAEKTAALEAVKQRLDQIDLGAVCLELYGGRSAPRALIAELRRTLDLGQPQADDPRPVARELTDLRRRLNQHAKLLHTPLEPSGLTPFELIGHLFRLARRGTPRAEVRLPSAPAWTRAEIAERRIQMEALTACLGRVGVPAVHAWRGARRAALRPEDLVWIEEQARQLSRSLEGLAQASEALHAGLSAEPSRNARELTRLLDTCEYLTEAPTPIDEAALGAACWTTRREEIAALVASGATLEASESRLRRTFLPAAWSAEIGELRRRLTYHARSPLRLLRRDYWRARGELRRLTRAPLPRSIEARTELLDSLREGQEARRQVERLRHLGAQAFGRLWRGTDSDWAQLARIEQWQGEGEDAQLLSDAPRLLPRIADRSRTGRLTIFTQQLLERITVGCEELFARLDLKLVEAFGTMPS
jgi:hypothetical protein